MDPIALGVIAVVVAGVVWFVLFRDNDTEEFPNLTGAKPVDGAVPQAPGQAPPTTADALKPKTSADAHKAAKPKVPAKADTMTKAQIESAARDQGVELDKRMTKANMIADWKKQLKAL